MKSLDRVLNKNSQFKIKKILLASMQKKYVAKSRQFHFVNKEYLVYVATFGILLILVF